MPVAEGLAILDDAIEVVRDDGREDRAALCVEVRRAWNFSPLVAIPIQTGPPGQRQDPRDDPESLFVNVTGCGHLFGGEHGLVSAMHTAWTERGYQVRIALAASPGVAWAVSHAAEWLSRPMAPLVVSPGRDIDWMKRLPVEALALPPTVVASLQELGLFDVGSVLELPSAELKRRFGEDTLSRIGRALGRRNESLEYLPPPDPIVASRRFEYPISRVEWLTEIQGELVEEVAERLRLDRRVTMQLAWLVKSEEAPGKSVEWKTRLVEPSCRASHLRDLVLLQMERRRWPRDVVAIEVSVEGMTVPVPVQRKLFDFHEEDIDKDIDRGMARLKERLSSRLGPAAVVRPVLKEATIPETVARLEAVVSAGEAVARSKTLTENESWNDRCWATRWGPANRPLWLESAPHRIEVVLMEPGGPPLRFLWKTRSHRVAHCWGPERIETGWWTARGIERDYYQVETIEGERFWLFRRRSHGDWFLHGVFE
jgi:protein ImuB